MSDNWILEIEGEGITAIRADKKTYHANLIRSHKDVLAIDKFYHNHDNWYSALVSINLLYIKYRDWKGLESCGWKEGIKYSEIFPCLKEKIDSGSIEDDFDGKHKGTLTTIRCDHTDYPWISLQLVGGNKLYVIDGQTRVVSLMYHGNDKVRAFIIDEMFTNS